MKVVLKHAGRWLHFSQPERVLQACSLKDVQPMLREAEESGLFAAGFVSYEAAPAFDPALKTHTADGFPMLCIGLFHAPDVLEEIHAVGCSSAASSVREGSKQGINLHGGSDGASPSNSSAAYGIGELKPSVSKQEFVEAIAEIKERIAEGATYQVNYTYRLNAGFKGDAWPFFCALVKGQRTEYAAFIETDDFTICSASPELFFNYSNGTILSRPMKGTARRGLTLAEDWKQAEALQQSEKDRAENIMVVDMIRNDIGRVAEPGSVETVSTYDVEKYPTVWQMTSTVRGNLAPEMSNRECRISNNEGRFCGIMQALFPCASITGAPKAKTMELIRELETSPRKIYTGSIGFMTPQGETCFNVAIRTALIDKKRSSLEFGVGGGIVWDSDAESEYEETLTKARILTQPRPDFQLLETMLWEPESGIYLLNGHMQRLGKSAAYFDVPLDMHAVFQCLENLGDERLRVRLLVSRDGNSEVQTFPMEDGGAQASATEGGQRPPLHIALAKSPIDSQDVFLYHKTTHRTVYEVAKADFPERDDVILWNEKGEVTESTIANIVIRKDGKLVTPPVVCGLLAGTFREDLLKSGEIEEGIITLDELKAAEEVFLVNSVRKWCKVTF